MRPEARDSDYLRDFVAEDEAKPNTAAFECLLYAHDRSLDPQLIWKGKDGPNRTALEVPSVPRYQRADAL